MSLQILSESVYVGLCLKIGTPQQVSFRRETADVKESFENQIPRIDHSVTRKGGSQREGFQLDDSDVDYLIWSDDQQVFWDYSQMIGKNILTNALILCDSSESPPGYTLLWLPLKAAYGMVLSSCVEINGALYISSAKYRERTCTLRGAHSTVHGPCSSGTHHSVLDYDYAHGFVSDFWPPSASSWKSRCHSWPQRHVVDNIVRSGCHFVAIGHRLCPGNHADNEWRISFSQAEQKLVYAMNHTQFLVYGLLKLFVKEINNELSEEEKLLCSYHMKTIIFWAIQKNTIALWYPQNLLAGSWVCFKLLLKCVYEGVCPNFFIPEDNMFLNKIHGAAQRKLFAQLYGLYEKGIAFLLLIPSINSCIMNILCNQILYVRTDENSLVSELALDREFFTEIFANGSTVGLKDIKSCIKYLHIVEQLITCSSSLTECQILMLQKQTATILQRCAFTSYYILLDMYLNKPNAKKRMYTVDKRCCYMLKLAAKFGFVSDLLYIAIYFYKTFRHREALSVLEMTKIKLAQPGLMYNRQVDPEMYTEAVGGEPRFKKMRNAVVFDMYLDNSSSCMFVPELTPEHMSSSLLKSGLFILPGILLHMLEFLCCRHVDPMKARAALDDLQVLVHQDQGITVPVLYKDISWEILGICQQMTGNHQAALYSYRQSLNQKPWNKIQTATRQRIQDLQQ
uniref:Uncharacterized protein LOC111135261 n=1 Tax=Crassostrea virginica TaxID=6565 RepID=A0A8B8ELV8_CRAVI|nr:uncharacterized protein LOC111135261 [Crassostrea virginica]XP_022340885.1 uncharacterized protein LOC111135261 [Crassostrea virginica]